MKQAKGGVDGALWTQNYGYDRYGNRTSVSKSGNSADGSAIPSDGLPSVTYNTASNRITNSGFQYDFAGNQTQSTDAGGVIKQYRYDSARRLAQVLNDSGGVLATYTYGASNQRLRVQEGGEDTYYAWDGGAIIAEYSAVGSDGLSWNRGYVYLGGRLLATNANDGTQYQHPDRLGTRLITSASDGSVISEQVGLPYGTSLPNSSTPGTGEGYQNGTQPNPHKRRFTSYDRSDVTGLDYAVNRHYNVQQGRFTQVDPIGMDAVSLESPQTLNLYAYCGNDPINQIDPDGLLFGWLKKLFGAIGKIFSNIFVKIAVVVALAVITLGAAAGLWSLINTVAIPGTAAVANAGLNALGWLAAGLGAVSGVSLSSFGGAGGFLTPPFNGGTGVGGVSNFLNNDPPKQSWQDWATSDGLQMVADFLAGFYDSLTFGITDTIREKLGTNRTINKCSGAYKTGEYAEVGGEILATGGSALLKQAAKSAIRAEVRREAAKMTAGIARNGKHVHHINPLFGHPGGKPTLFPTGGLPASIHSSSWNVKLLSPGAHGAAHRSLQAAERR